MENAVEGPQLVMKTEQNGTGTSNSATQDKLERMILCANWVLDASTPREKGPGN